jgi:5-methylcytosine-specific restriction endonuclease McrA
VGSQRKRDFTPQQLAALTPYDPDLEGGTWEGYRAQRQRAAAEEREREVAQWWAAYDAYLRSPEWRRRRRDTLARDGYRCQAALPGCDGRATQVHHLSYRHRGNEPLFDLTSVCDGCHAALHAAEATAPEGGLR